MIFDFAIIGAGIAGASLAAALGEGLRILILEAEEHPGYHTTGRSNAFWHPTYGGPMIAPLTLASKQELTPFLVARDALTLAHHETQAQLDAMVEDYAGTGIAFRHLDRGALTAIIPALKPGWDEGLLEDDAYDIDVAGYHAACLKRARQAGATLVGRAGVSALVYAGGSWQIETAAGTFSARRIVNAAGAWSDAVAAMAGLGGIAIQPYRRTIVQLALQHDVDADLPMVIDVAGQFYFRPEGQGQIWLSPHDETPSPACDAAPEELDIAIAIDRFEQVVDWPIRRVERSWAGLRSFAPDRLPVLGPDPRNPDFIWCVGQGGFGIQTAPAASAVCAASVLGTPAPAWLKGVDLRGYAPDRLI